jgi:hypothetical protein
MPIIIAVAVLTADNERFDKPAGIVEASMMTPMTPVVAARLVVPGALSMTI